MSYYQFLFASNICVADNQNRMFLSADCINAHHICERRYSKTVLPFLNIRAIFWSANIRKPFSNGDRHI